MTLKLHFETMTSGMAAKLDPRYRNTINYTRNLGKLIGTKQGSINFIEQFRDSEVSNKK